MRKEEKKSSKKSFVIGGVSLILFLILTLLVKTIDVKAIGPEGSAIGLSGINQCFFKLTGVHMIWYTITDWLGVVAIVCALGFGVLGLIQLIKRRSLLKVDADIWMLGLFYVVVAATYIFFETFIVNYRPILMEGYLEASFPSSHSMIVLSFMGAAMVQWKIRVKNAVVRYVLQILSLSVILVTVIGRLISGVHWLTDICAGVFLGLAFVCIYRSLVENIVAKFGHTD